jgi:hypothetical protein
MAQLVEYAGELIDILKASGANDHDGIEADYPKSEVPLA